MPSTAQRKKRRQNAITEKHFREDAEARNRVLEGQLQALTARAPVPRPGISTHWDWQCSCGRLVYSGKRSCDICGCSRAFSGTTVTGSVRGVLQTSQGASTAIARQQRVPGMAPASYAAVARAPPRAQSAAPERRGEQPTLQQQARATPEPARAVRGHAAVPAAKGADSGTGSKEKVQELPSSAVQIFNDENAGNAEEQDDDDEQTMFEDADADPKALRFRHINLCRKLEAKQKQLEKQDNAINEQKDEVAHQQAKLVELQAIADSTADKIKELQNQSAAIAMQIARIEDERRQVREAVVASLPVQASPPEALAADCLTKAAAALQGFQSQSPQVQLLLQQFTSFVDQLRAAESPSAFHEPRQTTLQQAFAHATASPQGTQPASQKTVQKAAGPTPSVPAAVPCFDISGSQPSEGQPSVSTLVADDTSALVAVVGECPGDKRKSECLLDSQPAADDTKELAHRPMDVVATQRLGTPMALPHVAVPFFVPQSRDELLQSLALRNKVQCAERKARTEAQHQKSCPY